VSIFFRCLMDAKTLRRSLKPYATACQQLLHAVVGLKAAQGKEALQKIAEALLDKVQNFVIEAPSLNPDDLKSQTEDCAEEITKLRKQVVALGGPDVATEGVEVAPVKTHIPSDAATWTCPSCRSSNLPIKKSCYSCNEERPDIAKDDKKSAPDKQEALKYAKTQAPKAKKAKTRRENTDVKDKSTMSAKISPEDAETQAPKAKKAKTRRENRDVKDKSMMSPENSPEAPKPQKAHPDDWFCKKCRHLNDNTTTHCICCKKEKRALRPGMWACPGLECSYHNYDSQALCVKCKTERSDLASIQKPGDWICVCGLLNYRCRTVCRNCEHPQPAVAASESEGSEKTFLKSWLCTCGERNSNIKGRCQKCHRTNPELHKQMMARDWLCQACSAMNFQRRFQCFICDQFRPTDNAAITHPDDWVCGSCKCLNFASRFACLTCSEPKAKGFLISSIGGARQAPVQAFTAHDPLDLWECPACGEKNGGTPKCGNCHMSRSAAAPTRTLKKAPAAPTAAPGTLDSWECPACGEKNGATPKCGNCHTGRTASPTATTATEPPKVSEQPMESSDQVNLRPKQKRSAASVSKQEVLASGERKEGNGPATEPKPKKSKKAPVRRAG